MRDYSSPEEGLPPEPPPTTQPQRVTLRLAAEKPWVVYILLGVTTLVFAFQYFSPYLITPTQCLALIGIRLSTPLLQGAGNDCPALLGMKVNSLILQGQFWRFFTPMFLHGSLLHIGFNLYALFIFGPQLERHYGHLRFLLLYVLGGFAGNVMSFLFSPNPSLGSSTAIFGLLGAEAIFLYQNRRLFGQTAQRALGNIITIAVINLIIGLSPGIDNWGHIGGLIGGTLFAWQAGPILKLEGVYPSLEIQDQREAGDTFRSALAVGVLFVALAAFGIFLRR